MKPVTLTISDIDCLNQIQKKLLTEHPLTPKQKTILIEFLSQVPSSELLLGQIPVPETVEFKIWDVEKLNKSLADWKELLWNIPGFDFAPNCYVLDNDSSELLAQGFIMTALFAPSLAYNTMDGSEAYRVMFKDDGSAIFQLPTLKDAEQFPELYSFKGSWKEAYYLLIETLKKGWPMEEFPEELQQFLKK